MFIILNRFIPFRGYKAMTVWPFLFIRKPLNYVDYHHEYIHAYQQRELLIIFFYLWYGVEYLIRLAIYRSHDRAYRNICFEREAYANEQNSEYIFLRTTFSFLKYI